MKTDTIGDRPQLTQLQSWDPDQFFETNSQMRLLQEFVRHETENSERQNSDQGQTNGESITPGLLSMH